MDPLIVAQTIAYTPVEEFVPLENILSNTREGIDGIGGMQTRGQYRMGMPGLWNLVLVFFVAFFIFLWENIKK